MPSMLIVDDDLHLRKLVLTYAQMENYQCREAENGEQALALLRERSADIIPGCWPTAGTSTFWGGSGPRAGTGM